MTAAEIRARLRVVELKDHEVTAATREHYIGFELLRAAWEIAAQLAERNESQSPPQEVAAPHPLESAVDWVLSDADYKAPEQIGPVAQRWITRLREARGDS